MIKGVGELQNLIFYTFLQQKKFLPTSKLQQQQFMIVVTVKKYFEKLDNHDLMILTVKIHIVS